MDTLRTAYSREEITDALQEWMIQNEGHPLELEPDLRNQWYRDNGLIYSFLCNSFPTS